MSSTTTQRNETSEITPCQKFEGHKDWVNSVIHLPGGQKTMTCSDDGSLRVWDLKSGKQIGEDWRDGKNVGKCIALSPDEKTVVSGGVDGAVRLWDTETCKVIARWIGHTQPVRSVCWSRNGRRVLSGSSDCTARQWDVESGETILGPIETEHSDVWAVVYSPDMTLIATGGRDGTMSEPVESPVKVWDAKTGKLVATLKGHVWSVRCLAWNKNVLVSGSYDCSIRIWNATKWEQTAVLDEHADGVTAIAISSNSRILASASFDYTARLWNLDNGQLIRSPLQHANHVYCVSFSADGKLLATGGREKHVNIWDVAAIVKEAGLDDILSDLKGDKSVLHANATRSPVQRRPPAPQVPQGFFDGVSPDRSNFSTQGRPRSSAQPSRTFLGSLFHRSPSDTNDTSPSSPLNWAQNLLKWRKRSGEEIELQVRNSAVVEVPYAKGKRRNASAREVAFAKQKQKQKQKQNTKPSHSKNSTAGSSMSINPNVAKSSQAADSSSATPAIGDATTTTGTTSTPSRPDVILRQAGLWTRIWLFIGCIPHEYTDDRH